ncbi:2-acyl-glycerophospho-ethanolamine acyltransferase [Planctomycetes bacterium Pla86]|uniref:2-acyl-glycerophospho-ethanolamine acyltransferase n=1 Tax=Engelhardtia mirabilis TaxID=2528011 RepID=A0A518BLI5_9BACT|nr:2-acyl-glycerophospho-ethanolamine acyltransferase [Planctomycetes bacterium Pla133]QDV02166.1 2-acyl-glycerophospho-ethanolamine acyltransferase [Planctomycetes bacterium Pla86]
MPALVLLAPAVVGRLALIAVGRRAQAERYSARVQRHWARLTLRAFGVRVDAAPRPPGGPYLVPANHLSWLDVLVLATQMDCRFVAKSEIAGWPVFGLLARSVGTLFVERGAGRDAVRVGAAMSALLESGISVVIFAEGQVSRGLKVERFHPALFEPAARAGLPCLPAALGYVGPAGGCGTAYSAGWWGDVGLVWHALRVGRFGPLTATVRYADRPLRNGDRKELALGSHRAVAGVFEPLGQSPKPDDDPRSDPPSGESLHGSAVHRAARDSNPR